MAVQVYTQSPIPRYWSVRSIWDAQRASDLWLLDRHRGRLGHSPLRRRGHQEHLDCQECDR